MRPNQKIWALSRNDLAKAVTSLGYPEEFADLTTRTARKFFHKLK